MSQSLNIRRLYLLLAKQGFENRKAYGLFFLMIAAFFIGWFAFMLMINNPNSLNPNNQTSIYFAGLFIAGCLSASLMFRDFNTKPKTINYLLLPAAALEKLLCVLFYGVLIFFIGFTLIFYITDIIAVKIANNANIALMSNAARLAEWRHYYNAAEPIYTFSPANVFMQTADTFVFYPGDNADLFTAFFPMQAAFILGAVYFRKNGFFKTIVVMLLIWMLFFILEDKVLLPFIPREARTSRLMTAFTIVGADGNDRIYSLPLWVADTADFLLRFAITPLLWMATYYRIKEKEI